ncbi:MAG: hypothetical protein SNJ72_01295, partial [Fimbriimonadales bacterium]
MKLLHRLCITRIALTTLCLTTYCLNYAQWTTSGTHIFYNTGNVGIGTTTPTYRLHVLSASTDRAIFGLHTATTGFTVGLYGQSQSTQGFAVLGYASATTGATAGVYGQADSTLNARGVFGLAPATTGFGYGVASR